jgi:hypothetical protein
MALDLVDYEKKVCEAAMAFRGNREKARQKQIEAGKSDQGERATVTAGNNMDGFVSLVIELVCANGLAHAQIHRERAVLALPGFFRPTKLWDILVIHEERLIAAIELKTVSDRSPHFPVFTEFQGASYLKRYDILCQRLMQEQLYTSASVLASPRSALTTGEVTDLSDMTSFKTFVTSFAGYIAAEAARS